ncbi:hypothetical protein LIER_20058 [Lithospermum erythrorhizon]|uniref:Maturase K n=1 Tax=Lithospermum erythrorhizon TaxID=34254 RepID=A0AAV3QL59_LITER
MTSYGIEDHGHEQNHQPLLLLINLENFSSHIELY